MGKFLMVLSHLESWFVLQRRILPWRESSSIYRVWVSEIMLQQTQVVTVIPFFERWMARFPTLQDLARAEVEEVLGYWAGLGYYSRARNLHRGAQKVLELGGFPKTRLEWLGIPGVGDYTSGAILSIACNQPEAILDGNVERVLSRVRRVTRQKGDAQFKSRLWQLSKIFVESAAQAGIEPRNLNQALMELGAMICTPTKPKCSVCPISPICRAHQRNDVESFPPKKKPKNWIHLEEKVHAFVNARGEVLLSVSEAGKWRAGLWDFPSQSPDHLFKKAKRLGQVETHYVVTRHKVKRVTEVWSVSNSVRSSNGQSVWKVAASELHDKNLCWVMLNQPKVPMGAPAKKVIGKVLKVIQEG